jgi:hypothetical protein
MFVVAFAKFILRYFIAFETNINQIASLSSFSVCVLLIYTKATGFYMLILYPATAKRVHDF